MRTLCLLLLSCLGCFGQAFSFSDPTVASWGGAPEAGGGSSSWYPTNISGMAYFWNYQDVGFTNIASWVDEIQGVNFTMADTAARPLGTSAGLHFVNPNWLTNTTGITLSPGFSFWGVISPDDSQGATATILMDDARNNGISTRGANAAWGIWYGGGVQLWSGDQTFVNPFSSSFHGVWANGSGYTNRIAAITTGTPSSDMTLVDIGKESGGNPYIGYIQYIGIWTNKTLSASDVTNLYTWANTNDAKNITSGLLAWWKMDEAAGTTVNDASGNGWTGYTTNSPAWTNAQINTGLNFDGPLFNANASSTQYITIPISTNLCHTNLDMSVSFWWKANIATNQSDPHTIIGDQSIQSLANDARYPGWSVIWDDASMRIQWTDGSHSLMPNLMVEAVSDVERDGAWHFYTFARDNTGTNSYCYFDGLRHILTETGTGTNGYFYSTNNIVIGAIATYTVPNIGFAPGSLDDVRLWNRRLSDTEVKNLYKWGLYLKTY